MLGHILRRLFSFETPSPSPSFVEPGRVLVLNPDGGPAAVRRSTERFQQELATKHHYLQFSRGELGWNLKELLRDATEKGEGQIVGHAHGNVGPLDPECRRAFSEALAPLGYQVTFSTYHTDGPEADRFVLSVRPARSLP